MDKKKHHGAMDKCSSEQQCCKSNMIIFAVEKFWSHTPSAIGSYGMLAGWQAGIGNLTAPQFIIIKPGMCQPHASACLVSWFAHWYVCLSVCLCVCPKGINNQWRDMVRYRLCMIG